MKRQREVAPPFFAGLPIEIWKKCVERMNETTCHVLRFTCWTLHDITHAVNQFDCTRFYMGTYFFHLVDSKIEKHMSFIIWVLDTFPDTFGSFLSEKGASLGCIPLLELCVKYNQPCYPWIWRTAGEKGHIHVLNWLRAHLWKWKAMPLCPDTDTVLHWNRHAHVQDWFRSYNTNRLD